MPTSEHEKKKSIWSLDQFLLAQIMLEIRTTFYCIYILKLRFVASWSYSSVGLTFKFYDISGRAEEPELYL